MTIPGHFWTAAKSLYAELQFRDYPQFQTWVQQAVNEGSITKQDAQEVFARFPDRPSRPPNWEEEDDAVAYISDPPDPGPLAKYKDHGWIPDEIAKKLRLTEPELQRRLGIRDGDVLVDIQENALHILGRCTDPKHWDKNRQGLVYGMVQSGKTASMIELMLIARTAGYRLFILLSSDKTSLREQTQSRVNQSFDLTNGANAATLIYSPTWNRDFGHVGGGYAANFRYYDIHSRKKEWAVIIVIKKQTDHFHELLSQIELLKGEMAKDGEDFAAVYPTLILDDEADYGSMNTAREGADSTIHKDVVALRKALPRNTYVGYTATPQACLSARPDDPVGYPKDFFWLLEPYMEEVSGSFRPRTYLGAWEAFWIYDRWLLNRMGRDEWPHHEKDASGKSLGVYVPPMPPKRDGVHTREQGLPELEAKFLQEVLDGTRPTLPSIRDALLDFMIGCGVRWWRAWRREGKKELPSKDWIIKGYPHHAVMIHLSMYQENQELIRRLVQRQWDDAVRLKMKFDERRSAPDDPFRVRWRRQCERSADFFHGENPPFKEVSWFVDRCVEIAREPIYDDRQKPYRHYPGSPFVYLLNSTPEGNELYYSPDADPEIRTKKAAIIVGGNILSRGLTVEGLSVSVFGRTANLPLGDATLQMGRWLGHRMGSIDTVAIYLQDGVREVLRQVADADRYLRLQIKDAIIQGHRPDRVLLEMRNSPFFRVTSYPKSRNLAKGTGGPAFAGKVATLNEPSFAKDDIIHNLEVLRKFEARHKGERAHARAILYRGVSVKELIRLFREFSCPEEASQVSFARYASYLQDWLDGDGLPSPPSVNVAVMDGQKTRHRITSPQQPISAREARDGVTGVFGSIIGGVADDGKYLGDAFLDKDPKWHERAAGSTKKRAAGEEILVVLYRLDPNYVTKKLWDPTRKDTEHPMGNWKSEEVRLGPSDPKYVTPVGPPKEFSVITFAAWTPSGGPMYEVATNKLIAQGGTILQRGRDQTGPPAEAEA